MPTTPKDSMDMRRASKEQMEAYLEIAPGMRTRKENRGGIIGLTESDRGWLVNWPKCVRMAREQYRNPVQACARYNQVMMKLFGEEAVLCDPLVATGLTFYPEPKRGRPRTTT